MAARWYRIAQGERNASRRGFGPSCMRWSRPTGAVSAIGKLGNLTASIRGTMHPERRRPMTDEQFQTLLRGSDPRFRRFLIFLKFTGCRPGEAASMHWADVRFDEASVVLRGHKTARKTGRG